MINIIKKYRFIIISLLCFYSCYQNTELAKCDPEKGRFINGQHFVLSNIMNDDKKIDYYKWYRQLKNRITFQPNCIPIERKKSLEEKLDDLTKVADLSR